jgi:hypothetical protein
MATTVQQVAQQGVLGGLNATLQITPVFAVQDYPATYPQNPLITVDAGPFTPAIVVILGSPGGIAVWSATVSFQSQPFPSGAFVAASAFPTLGGNVYQSGAVTSATGPGQWIIPVSPTSMTKIQVNVTAYVSGIILALIAIASVAKLANGQYVSAGTVE